MQDLMDHHHEHPPGRPNPPAPRQQRQAAKRALQKIITTNDYQNEDWVLMEEISKLLTTSQGLVFSGAGISAAAGLNVFSSAPSSKNSFQLLDNKVQGSGSETSKKQKPKRRKLTTRVPRTEQSSRNADSSGWYAEAQRMLLTGNQSGMEVFRYHFLQENPFQCFHFQSCMYHQASQALPTLSHQVVQTMMQQKTCIRHYTTNIDGLATHPSNFMLRPQPSSPTLSPRTKTSTDSSYKQKDSCNNPVVELHGSLHELVCRDCQNVFPTAALLSGRNTASPTTIMSSMMPSCPGCQAVGRLRFRILFYDDRETMLLASHQQNQDILEQLCQDVARAKWIVWVGLSFRQQATCEYFRHVCNSIQDDIHRPQMFLVDPRSAQVLEDLETAVGHARKLVHAISMTSDEFFRAVETKITHS